VIVGLVGCSQSYHDSMQSAVQNMRGVIETYNKAAPHDLNEMASVCSTAYDDLTHNSASLQSATPPAKYRAEATQLRSAYVAAKAGFSECIRASRTLDTALSADAQGKIVAANNAISSARSLDR
jgi:hypothetical protein